MSLKWTGAADARKLREMTVERKVNVWGNLLVIDVYEESRRVWVAQGDYMDERIAVKGSTATSAAALWEKAARQKSAETSS